MNLDKSKKVVTYEPLQLVFYTIKDEYGVLFHSKHTGNINKHMFVSHLLSMLDTVECEHIIESIKNAQNGLPFQPYHGPDSMSDDDQFDIVPPNIIYGGGEWSMPMEEWKRIMQAWKDFIVSNS